MLSVYRPAIALTSYKAQLLQVTRHINLKGYADEKFMEEIVIFKQLVLFQRRCVTENITIYLETRVDTHLCIGELCIH